ncbi:MAG: hypothetical protein ACOY3Y_08310 [Acidobacteriota bacterium]
MVFLEHNVDARIGRRQDRWWAAYGSGGTVYLPLVMADSGHRFASGTTNFTSVCRTMVNAELARPADADIEAWAERSGDTVRVWVRATNRTAAALSAAENSATVHALVWEEARVGTTGRYVRGAPWAMVEAPLATGESAGFALVTPTLVVHDWSKIHTTVVLDYRPGGSTGAYDMLQAAHALPPALSLAPAVLELRSDAASAGSETAVVALSGPPGVRWTATPGLDWVEVVPATGQLPASATVRLVRDRLPPGTSHTSVAFGASGEGLLLAAELAVSAERIDPPRAVRRRVERRDP